jgi:hypothetical protein
LRQWRSQLSLIVLRGPFAERPRRRIAVPVFLSIAAVD